MNYTKFQKELLTRFSDQKKVNNFSWDYDDGYYYITLNRCEIFRVPSPNMILNLGMIKMSDAGLARLFKDMSDCCDKDLVPTEPTVFIKNNIEGIHLFENSDIIVDRKKLEKWGKLTELEECCHFRTGGREEVLAIYNEADECIGLLMKVK